MEITLLGHKMLSNDEVHKIQEAGDWLEQRLSSLGFSTDEVEAALVSFGMTAGAIALMIDGARPRQIAERIIADMISERRQARQLPN